MKSILHVGAYEFNFEETGTPTLIAEILKNKFAPTKYTKSLEVTLEFLEDDFVDDISEALEEPEQNHFDIEEDE